MNTNAPKTYNEILDQVRNGEDIIRGNFIQSLRSILLGMGFAELHSRSDGRWWQSLAAVHKNGYVMNMTSSVKRTERVTWAVSYNQNDRISGAFQSQTGLKRAVKELIRLSLNPKNTPFPYTP